MEEWKDIPGYEGYYQVSNKGRLRSLKRVVKKSDGKTQTVPERYMKPKPDKKGYSIVGVSKNANKKYLKLHRVVAQSFIPNTHNKPQVNHLDGNKQNNKVENLEWSTQKENNIHALREGLRIPQKGEEHSQAKLTAKEVILIRDIHEKGGRTQQCIADEFNVSRRLIGMIVKREVWPHI